MTLTIEGLKAVLAEGPEKEREHRQLGRELVESGRKMVAEAPDDTSLQMIVAIGEKLVQQVERADQLELLLLALGIQSLERIERLEARV